MSYSTKMKKCKVCGEEKNEFEFGAGVSNGRQHLKNICNKCRYIREKDRKLDNFLIRTYNINNAEREMILKSQDNKCKLCGKELDGKINTDHNHLTEVVRGLLCSNCNRILRYFDDPILHDKFMDYSKNANALRDLRIYLENT